MVTKYLRKLIQTILSRVKNQNKSRKLVNILVELVMADILLNKRADICMSVQIELPTYEHIQARETGSGGVSIDRVRRVTTGRRGQNKLYENIVTIVTDDYKLAIKHT